MPEPVHPGRWATLLDPSGGTVDADALRRGHVERARHRAHPDRRRYLAVAPDNRLVAAGREADWDDALRALQTAREDSNAPAEAAASLPMNLRDRSIRSVATDSPHSGPPPTPRSGTAHAPSASSTTSPCTRPTVSTCTFCGSAADKPPVSPSRSRRRPGRSAKPTPTPSPPRPAPRHPHVRAAATHKDSGRDVTCWRCQIMRCW